MFSRPALPLRVGLWAAPRVPRARIITHPLPHNHHRSLIISRPLSSPSSNPDKQNVSPETPVQKSRRIHLAHIKSIMDAEYAAAKKEGESDKFDLLEMEVRELEKKFDKSQTEGYLNDKYAYSDLILLTSDVSSLKNTIKELQLTTSDVSSLKDAIKELQLTTFNLQSQLQKQQETPIPNTAPITATPQPKKKETNRIAVPIMISVLVTFIVLVYGYSNRNQEKKLRDEIAKWEEQRIAEKQRIAEEEEEKERKKKHKEFEVWRDCYEKCLLSLINQENQGNTQPDDNVEIVEMETTKGRSWVGGLGGWIWR